MPIGDTSPAYGLKQVLAAASPAVISSTWPVFIGNMPSDPDRCMSIRDYGGLTAEVGLAVDYPKVQVKLRGSRGATSYPETYDQAKKVFDALVGIPSRPVAWPNLVSVVPVGHIVPIGRDQSDRELITVNFQLIVAFDTAGHREAIT